MAQMFLAATAIVLLFKTGVNTYTVAAVFASALSMMSVLLFRIKRR